MSMRGTAIFIPALALLVSGCSGGSGTPGAPAQGALPGAAADKIEPVPATTAQCRQTAFDTIIVTLAHSYIRDVGSNVATYAQAYCVKRIFLNVPIGDYAHLEHADPATVSALNDMFAVADVYMMAGNLNWLSTPSAVPANAAELTQKVGPMYPRFKGVLFDIEPQAYPTWSSDREGTIRRYFELLSTMFGAPQPTVYGQTILATAPYWAQQPNSSGSASPTMLQQAESLPQASGTYMMAYSTPATLALNQSQPAFSQMRKMFFIGATADQGGGASSYYGTTPSEFLTNVAALYAGAHQANANAAGVFVNAWNDQNDSLQTLLPQP